MYALHRSSSLELVSCAVTSGQQMTALGEATLILRTE